MNFEKFGLIKRDRSNEVLYDAYAFAYLNNSDMWSSEPSMRNFATWVMQYAEVAKKTIVDIGCGRGLDSNFFLDRGYKVIGVDMVQTFDIQKLAMERSNFTFIQKDVFDLDNFSFDDDVVIFDNGVLHHYDIDKIDLLLKFYRSRFSPTSLCLNIFFDPREQDGALRISLPDGRISNIFSFKLATHLLESNGFTLEHYKVVERDFHNRWYLYIIAVMS